MTADKSLQPINVLHRDIPALTGVNRYQQALTQVIYVRQGVLAVITDQGRYIVPPKQAIIITADSHRELVAKTQVSLSIFTFDNQQASILADDNGVIAVNGFVQALFEQAQPVTETNDWQGRNGRLLRLIRDDLASAGKLDTFLPYPQDARLCQITEKLLKHPSLKSDLASWGKFVQTSSRTLSRLFRKETGITYSEWRQRLNVQIAIKHLASGDSINSIASLLGYESSSAFIYMFKKQMGTSPHQFLKP